MPAEDSIKDALGIEQDGSMIAGEPQIQIVHVFQHIDPSAMMLADVDVSKVPVFRTRQVAIIFFQKSPGWLRWRDRQGFFVSENFHCEPARNDQNTRFYTLADIEVLAHAFDEHGIIDAMHLEITLHIIRLIAIGYGVIL